MDDPTLEIRIAVAEALRQFDVAGDHKAITDRAIDNLPSFFRQPLIEGHDKILTDAERLVEEIVSDVREAIFKKAIKLSKGPHLTIMDIEAASSGLFENY